MMSVSLLKDLFAENRVKKGSVKLNFTTPDDLQAHASIHQRMPGLTIKLQLPTTCQERQQLAQLRPTAK